MRAAATRDAFVSSMTEVDQPWLSSYLCLECNSLASCILSDVKRATDDTIPLVNPL
jgi:hypothetical protein